MKKLAAVLLCLIVLAGIGLYLSSGAILTKASDKVVDYVATNAQSHNFEYIQPAYSSVKLSSLNAATWTDISVNAGLARDGAKTGEDIALKIGEMTVSMDDFSNQTLLISADGVSATLKERGDKAYTPHPASSMENGHLEMQLSLNGFSKDAMVEQLRTLKEEIKKLSTLGVTKIPLTFSATAKFQIQNKPFVAKFSVSGEGEEYRLAIDKNDLQKIVAQLPGPKPNPAEIELIARNPFKVSVLTEIRDKAANTAGLAFKKNPKISEDAYRHTLWSYLLTKTYGEEFAKQVTDAHEAYADEEELSKPLDFSVASYQDLTNNAVGRQYALKNYKESEILERVMTDLAIIRDNEAAERFDLLDYSDKLKPVISKEDSLGE